MPVEQGLLVMVMSSMAKVAVPPPPSEPFTKIRNTRASDVNTGTRDVNNRTSDVNAKIRVKLTS